MAKFSMDVDAVGYDPLEPSWIRTRETWLQDLEGRIPLLPLAEGS